jgi:hypothetical protein
LIYRLPNDSFALKPLLEPVDSHRRALFLGEDGGAGRKHKVIIEKISFPLVPLALRLEPVCREQAFPDGTLINLGKISVNWTRRRRLTILL